MKNIILIFIILLATFSGCNKDKERTSLLGSWNCEEFGEGIAPRVYQVNIERNNYIPDATNEYTISNFNKRGFGENDLVYVRFDESEMRITITGSEQISLYVSGFGTVADDFSSITWEYTVSDGSISNLLFEATYY